MKLNFNKCVGCGACYSVCLRKCITMKNDGEGFLYPRISNENCINCNLCDIVCPILSIDLNNDFKRVAYACYTKDDITRKKSSSGGVFTELAKTIIKKGGVAFGAAFSDDFMRVEHIAVDNLDYLEKLRQSKYVQSNIGEAYKEAEKYLKENRIVLFTGTPCQIAGLKKYLRKDYDNLFTQDLICHGAPSPLVWRKYVEYRSHRAKSNIRNISFRNKSNGWKDYNIKFEFCNGTEYRNSLSEDIYMLGFLKNFYLRKSCYNCQFKNGQGNSDITLADFWGVENVLPEMDDNKGTSFVIINTKKGMELFDKISDKLIVRETKLEYANKYNSAYVKSVEESTIRKKVFRDIKVLGVFRGIKKNLEISTMKRIMIKANGMLIVIKRYICRNNMGD